MKVVTYADVISNLESIFDGVVNDVDATVITRSDSESAVIMSLSNYNSLMETVYLLDSPANSKHLCDSIAQYRAAKGLEMLNELDKLDSETK